MAKRKLIVVASRFGASLYEHTLRSGGLKLVRELSNPDGRLRTQDIDSDRSGRAHNARPGSFGIGSAYSPQVSPTEKVAMTFARDLARVLEDEAYKGSWDSFVIVAEPRLLGMIKSVLGNHATAKIGAFVQKDLGKISNHDLPDYLEEVI